MSNLTDDPRSGTFTERGWPRPIINGWPIPWVSPAEHLARTHPDRHKECVDWAKCHVCGEEHEAGSTVYFLVNGDISEWPVDLSDKVVQMMDDACMHERCMKLAAGRCPALRDMRSRGKLYLFAASRDDVKIFTVDKEDDEDDGREVLGVHGSKVWKVDFPEEES